MTTGKSLLITFVVLVTLCIYQWYVVIFPLAKANDFFQHLPTIIDSQVINRYPPDLIVTISRGQLSINQASLYCLPIYKGINLLYDADAQPSLDTFGPDGKYSKSCPPTILAGQNFVMYPDKSSSYKINQFPPDLNLSLNRTTMENGAKIVIPVLLQYGRLFYYLAPLVFTPIAFLFIVSMNSWYKFVAGLILNFFKIAYDRSLLFGTSLIVYITLLLLSWGLKFSFAFPFSNTIIITVICLIYFKSRSPAQPDSGQTQSPLSEQMPASPSP